MKDQELEITNKYSNSIRYLSHGGSGIRDNKLNIEYDTYHMDDQEIEITNIYSIRYLSHGG